MSYTKSPFKDENSSEGMIRAIDEEIREYESHLKALRSRRNAIVPVSRLPPEVLCKIFERVREDTSRGILAWIKVSHVDRHWREVAINSPCLWTHPPLAFACWNDEFLARSKMANLVVEYKPTIQYYGKTTAKTPVAFSSLTNIIKHHSSRIRQLRVALGGHLDIMSLFSLLPKSAPSLESLVMDTTAANTIIPDAAFCEMGRIRRLDLNRISINWNLHLHSTLTSLRLHNIPTLALPTKEQFWSALKRMSLLETLDLRNSLPLGKNVSPQETIDLPCLKLLSVSSGIVEVEALLRTITFPSTTVITADCREEGRTRHSHFVGILSLLARSTESSGKKICLADIDLTETSLAFRAYETMEWADLDLEESFLELSLSWKGSMCSVEKLLGFVLRELPMDDVVQLRTSTGVMSDLVLSAPAIHQ